MATTPQRFADRYESVLVPVIFRPWARELIGRVHLKGGENVLDLACGTGVVIREIAKTAVPVSSLTGMDHSADMLEAARTAAEAEGVQATWVEGDAGNLPFPDNSFETAFCQQALQFFPDRPAAARELNRVMRPGGKFAACIQCGLSENPMLRAQAKALEQHVGPDAGAAVRAICGWPDAEPIYDLFTTAGFKDVEVEKVTLILWHPDGRAFAEGAMGGMHTGDKLSGIDESDRRQSIDAFLSGLGEHYDGKAIRFPHVSHVVTARADS